MSLFSDILHQYRQYSLTKAIVRVRPDLSGQYWAISTFIRDGVTAYANETREYERICEDATRQGLPVPWDKIPTPDPLLLRALRFSTNAGRGSLVLESKLADRRHLALIEQLNNQQSEINDLQDSIARFLKEASYYRSQYEKAVNNKNGILLENRQN